MANPHGAGKKMKLAFPPTAVAAPLRTKESVLAQAAEASATRNKVKGVYGPTVLSTIEGYDYIQGTINYYMHGTSGIGKDTLRLWTESKYSKEPWLVVFCFVFFSDSLISFLFFLLSQVLRDPRWSD